jgi:hypothetical protein
LLACFASLEFVGRTPCGCPEAIGAITTIPGGEVDSPQQPNGFRCGWKKCCGPVKKWGKFQLVTDPKEADLIFLLSADPYKGGNIVFASGQTGSIDNGHVTEDPIPDCNKLSPTRYAYLTVIDPETGDNLWSRKHVWGGLLTGFNSVGERLIKELESQTKR